MTLSKKICLYKSIVWRIISTLTTFIISWILTGDVLIGIGIAGIEFWLKMIIYYQHELAWLKYYKHRKKLEKQNKKLAKKLAKDEHGEDSESINYT